MGKRPLTVPIFEVITVDDGCQLCEQSDMSNIQNLNELNGANLSISCLSDDTSSCIWKCQFRYELL